MAAQLQRHAISYAVVGSFASSIWGESRLTQDIDVVVDLKPSQSSQICGMFPDPEFYISPVAVGEAVAQGTQFNVINPSSGNKIDFMIPGRKHWVLAQLARSKKVPVFPDQNVNVASPDDVILGKLVYYREGGSDKHLRDIRGILSLSGTLVDREYLARQAKFLHVDDLWEGISNSDSTG